MLKKLFFLALVVATVSSQEASTSREIDATNGIASDKLEEATYERHSTEVSDGADDESVEAPESAESRELHKSKAVYGYSMQPVYAVARPAIVVPKVSKFQSVRRVPRAIPIAAAPVVVPQYVRPAAECYPLCA